MTGKGRAAELDQIKAEVLRELAGRQPRRRGLLARLFG